MKRLFLLLIAFIFVSNVTLGQKTIRMEKEGGIFKISCKVNGAPMKMYFDTGASTVSISKATAIYLLDNDLIGPQDFRGTTKTTTADGAIADKMVINIRDIEIAGLHLRNVKATVSYSLNAPLLLGQTAIQRLGKISLQGNILTIHTNTSSSNQQNIKREEFDDKLRDLIESNKDNYEIIEIIENFETYNQLNEFELFCKIVFLARIPKYEETISAAQTWIDRYATKTDSIKWKMTVFFIAAEANIMGEGGDKEKGMEYIKRCSNYWRSKSDSTSVAFWGRLPMIIGAYCEYKKAGYVDAIYAAKESAKFFLKFDNITLEEINNNKFPNWKYGFCLGLLSALYVEQQRWLLKQDSNYIISDYEFNLARIYLMLAAKVGNQDAMDSARRTNYDYTQRLTNSELNLTGIQ